MIPIGKCELGHPARISALIRSFAVEVRRSRPAFLFWGGERPTRQWNFIAQRANYTHAKRVRKLVLGKGLRALLHGTPIPGQPGQPLSDSGTPAPVSGPRLET